MSGTGARLNGGRWNPKGIATLYLSDAVASCRAEFHRMAQRGGGTADDFLPRALHVVEGRELQLVDLTSPGALEAVGLTIAAVEDPDDWAPCQRVGDAANFLGFQGLYAVSATGVGHAIVVFEGRLEPGQLSVIDSTTLDL